MPHHTLINGTDLHHWSNRRASQSDLPILVRRLVRASASGLVQVSFAADEGIQLGGWDGTVRASAGNAHVPSGTSCWELGTNSDVKGKADGDYEKRTDEPGGLDPKQTTFVFVTSRRWAQKEKWAQARRKEGKWLDVRAYDADDLAVWLEAAPAVHIWASILLGSRPEDAVDIASYWAEWAAASRYRIAPELVVAGRTEVVNAVQEWLAGSPAILDVQGETVQEAVAFYAASVQQLPQDERERVQARSVVVESPAAWRRLALSESPLILLPIFEDRTAIPLALARGHHVLLPLGMNEASGDRSARLERPRREAVREALVAMRVPETQLEELATLGRKSLSALMRRMAVNPALLTPEWASPAEARVLLPALLAGRWHDSCASDREVLSALAGRDYSEVCAACVRWASEADPFLRKVGDTWLVVSREDSWLLLSRFLTREDLERLQRVAADVLGRRDPQYELEPGQRFAASIYGKSLPHSSHLREGLAEALALMASRPELGPVPAGEDGQEWADRIVAQLLKDTCEWHAWASLSAVLSSLAEASPARFLDAVGQLADTPGAVTRLFAQEDSRFGGSPHCGLLWALELLAWSPDHLARAALQLARLARLDPGGKLVNRPLNSLKQVLLSWYPCTAASAERRLRVIDLLRSKEPAVAWALMKGILPRRHGTAQRTATPKFRDWVGEPVPRPTHAEVGRTGMEVLKRLLGDAGADVDRWCDLIELADEFADPEFGEAISGLLALAARPIGAPERERLRCALREVISRHVAFPDAEWAMPAERVEQLHSAYAAFEPDSLLERHAWLFTAVPRFPLPETEHWSARETALEDLRRTAVEELYAEGGLPAVLDLAGLAEEPGHVGWAAGKSGFRDEAEAPLLRDGLGSANFRDRNLALGYAQARAAVDPGWLEDRRTSGLIVGDAAQADFHRLLPFNQRTWELVAALGLEVERAYWGQTGYYGLGALDDEDLEFVAQMLAKHGRLPDALRFAALYSRDGSPRLPIAAIADLLDRISNPAAGDDLPWGDLRHDVAELLGVIEQSGEVEPQRIARLEWLFLPLLEYSSYRPKVLHRALATEPEFFREVITWVYKGRHDEPHDASVESERRARLGFDLLRGWRHMPGVDEEGNVDAAALRAWTLRTQELLRDCDRAEVGDQQIGQALSRSPVGADGAWPHEAVREVIEEVASEHLETGIATGLFNGRGVTMRRPADGGAQERALAEGYRQHARAAQDRWPRTAALLERIANDFDRHARYEDLSADLQQDLWR